ncbi:DUF3696 domain-containing protein [Vibrio sp. 10N.261.49.A5]|uniref:DUF3696 domain-containing protein n=1 Tax=Vibrio tasmaniensis 1F-267 TaxID=1191324 RepID=A0ABX3B7C7_9VIBR|nr:DUF3696 domain-containing protein [Vibrio tasmaniensis]OEF47924.1 hypothetical protein A163_06545 [Vibrio tasmaniensis 1F-267]
MLRHLEIKNLKGIDTVTLELAPLTLLTGANSSGKSTVIQALMLLIKNSQVSNRYSMEDLVRYLSDFTTIRNKKNNAKSIELAAVDSDNTHHSIKLTSDGVEKSSQLPYLYELEANETDKELLYLNANRIGAQDLVQVSERKVGNLGEYLFSTFEKVKGNILSESLLKFDGSQTMSYQVGKWLSFITGSETELITEKSGDQVRVYFNVKDIDSNVSPFNLGAGMSYIAKVIIICLMSKKGDLVLIENPEVQLHPKAQAQLGAFLSFVANSEVQLVVETHSDHILNAVRVAIKEGELSSDDSSVYFFERSEGESSAQATPIKINDDGSVDKWPEGFFDEWDIQLDRLLGIEYD